MTTIKAVLAEKDLEEVTQTTAFSCGFHACDCPVANAREFCCFHCEQAARREQSKCPCGHFECTGAVRAPESINIIPGV